MGRNLSHLSREDERELAGLEIRDLDLAPDHVDARAVSFHGDAKLGSFDDGGEIGRLDLKVLNVALFHFEQNRTCLLKNGRR